jgi:dihydrofolate reductase
MVIGGGELYRACLPRASAIHLTDVDADVEGDVYLPGLDARAWQETWSEHHPADERHAYAFTFRTLERRSAAIPG